MRMMNKKCERAKDYTNKEETNCKYTIDFLFGHVHDKTVANNVRTEAKVKVRKKTNTDIAFGLLKYQLYDIRDRINSNNMYIFY